MHSSLNFVCWFSTLRVLWKITVILAPISISNFKAHNKKPHWSSFQLLYFNICNTNWTTKTNTCTHDLCHIKPCHALPYHIIEIRASYNKRKKNTHNMRSALRHYLLKLFASKSIKLARVSSSLNASSQAESDFCDSFTRNFLQYLRLLLALLLQCVQCSLHVLQISLHVSSPHPFARCRCRCRFSDAASTLWSDLPSETVFWFSRNCPLSKNLHSISVDKVSRKLFYLCCHFGRCVCACIYLFARQLFWFINVRMFFTHNLQWRWNCEQFQEVFSNFTVTSRLLAALLLLAVLWIYIQLSSSLPRLTWLRSSSHFFSSVKKLSIVYVSIQFQCNRFYSNDTRLPHHFVFETWSEKIDFIGISKIVLFIFDGYSSKE